MMKLIRLQVANFAGIGTVEIEFGPGLNVLYGPNDLGKSTVAESIRLALLLPHASTHADAYVAWAGGGEPTVQLTFEAEAQRIWRVRKQFGRQGSSLLEESRNGQDFDEVERGRKVDGKLREILRWGIPEPGGAHAPKGLPVSFLSTALLSPQSDVSAVLDHSLQEDSVGSGKEQIAAALQAVAQDPLFVELLKRTQEKRDAAYTDKGAKKTAKGSVFKEAAERLNEARIEKERLQRTVEDSEGAEQQLRELTARRATKQEQWATASAHAATLEQLARQRMDRSSAKEQMQVAEAEVRRINDLRSEVDATERRVTGLTHRIAETTAAVEAAKDRLTEANVGLASAQEAARAEQADPSLTDTRMQLRRSVAERAAREAEQRIEVLLAAKNAVDAASAAERELQAQERVAGKAKDALAEAEAREKTANEELVHCGLLETMLQVQAADRQLKAAQDAVDKKAGLEARRDEASIERAILVAKRAAIIIPAPSLLAPMRRLATDLAAARGALDVGIIATLTPYQSFELTIEKDGGGADSLSIVKTQEIEASAELEIIIAGMASIRVQGGRREAQARAAALEERWKMEVATHLLAAGVSDLEGLGARVEEAQRLDAGIHQKEGDLASLQLQISSHADAAETLRRATENAGACRGQLRAKDFDRLAAEVRALGVDATSKLARRRQQCAKDIEGVRGGARQAANIGAIAQERTSQLRRSLDAAVGSRDLVLKSFPEGVDAALLAARAEHTAQGREQQAIDAELASLQAKLDDRKKRIDLAERGARAIVEKAGIALESAQKEREAAIAEHALADGRLMELRRNRDAANLSLALEKLQQATSLYHSLPVPDRMVENAEVTAAQASANTHKAALEGIERDVNRAHGALEHVGGAVARERLADATDAFELAERQEREIEAESEAWKLLLEQMKEADAAQASNLGFALVPAIANQFNELTRQRYESVKLNAQLATEGVVVSGAVRTASHLSVGTREQLSTLFRLSLAQYLHTAIVLDDQLVQSDVTRMDWFRTLLYEKARDFQIIVLTCRPSDYLPAAALVPKGSAVHVDLHGEPIRAVDLGRAIRRR